MKLSMQGLISISKNNIVDGVSSNSEIGRGKSWANFEAKLSKCKLLAKSSFGPGFLNPGARLVLSKQQSFIILI